MIAEHVVRLGVACQIAIISPFQLQIELFIPRWPHLLFPQRANSRLAVNYRLHLYARSARDRLNLAQGELSPGQAKPKDISRIHLRIIQVEFSGL